MEYIYTITTTDANGNPTLTEYAIDATDARTAHNAAAHAANNADNVTIRVYPSTLTTVGIMRGAVMVGRRTAINAIKRQGTPTQHRIEREFAAINARLVGAETPERINAVIADYSADTQDFYGYALLGLQEGRTAGADISEQYHTAFLTLNKFIHSQRAATDFELSTEFITDGGGDIVSINSVVSCIIRGGEKWIPTNGGGMDAPTAARLGAAITDAMRIVSPTQRDIARLLGYGYSQRQIAEKMNRSVSTTAENIAIMRGKIAKYIRDNAPEFAYMVDGGNGESTIKTEEIAAAKTVNKRKSAEYYREYRARKAAERAAARQNG